MRKLFPIGKPSKAFCQDIFSIFVERMI